MSAADRYRRAAMAMAKHIHEQNLIEEEIHALRKKLQEHKDQSWPIRQEYREAHEALLIEAGGGMLPRELIPPIIVSHDLEPEDE